MRKSRLVVAIVLLCSLVFAPFNHAYANTSSLSNTQDACLEETQSFLYANSEIYLLSSNQHKEDIGIAPRPYLPFIYSAEETYAWLGEEVSNEIRDLDEGYLYVLNEETKQFTKILNRTAHSFAESNDYLFVATDEQEIVRTNYLGLEPTVIYKATFGDLAALNYNNAILCFSDGNMIIQLDTITGVALELLAMDRVTYVYPYEDGHMLLRNEDDVMFHYDIEKEQLTELIDDYEVSRLLDDSTIFVMPYNTEILTSESAEYAANRSTDPEFVSLPMIGFMPGSYFTVSGTACLNHSNDDYSNCRRYACTNQCDGFARYVSEHYYHVSGGEWTAPYSVYGDRISNYPQYYSFGSESNLRSFFNKLNKGVYVRVSSRNAANDTGGQGTHSYVYIAHDSQGAILYEANTDNQCGVKYHYRTYDDLLSRYAYFFGWVNHNQEGTATQRDDTYHKVCCGNSGCAAYIIEEHTYTYSAGVYECSGCGYMTDTPMLNLTQDERFYTLPKLQPAE